MTFLVPLCWHYFGKPSCWPLLVMLAPLIRHVGQHNENILEKYLFLVMLANIIICGVYNCATTRYHQKIIPLGNLMTGQLSGQPSTCYMSLHWKTIGNSPPKSLPGVSLWSHILGIGLFCIKLIKLQLFGVKLIKSQKTV